MDPNRLDVCPSLLTEGYNTYCNAALKDLFDGVKVSHILDFNSPVTGGIDGRAAVNNAGRLSLSGAQPKFGMVLDSDGTLRYSKEKEQSTYILKPQPVGYHLLFHEYCAANEHATMQIASQVYSIETAPNGVCFFRDGQMAYITRRFDVHPKGKYAIEESPAYDLMNTSIHIYEPRIFALERGLFKEGMQLSDTKGVCAEDFMEFGRRLGLPEKIVRKEIERFAARNEKADNLVERSFLSAELKRSYLQSYHYRQSMLRP